VRSRNRDKTKMTNTKTWPWFSYLPLKRQAGKQRELGLLFYDFVNRDVKPIVLLANLLLPEDEKRLCDKLSYQSFDDMLDDGWVID
jgi:hypothetical protein